MKKFTEDELDQAFFFDVYNIKVPNRLLKFVNKVLAHFDAEIIGHKVEQSSGLRHGDYVPRAVHGDIAIDTLRTREGLSFDPDGVKFGDGKLPKHNVAGGPIHPSEFTVSIDPPFRHCTPRSVYSNSRNVLREPINHLILSDKEIDVLQLFI